MSEIPQHIAHRLTACRPLEQQTSFHAFVDLAFRAFEVPGDAGFRLFFVWAPFGFGFVCWGHGFGEYRGVIDMSRGRLIGGVGVLDDGVR